MSTNYGSVSYAFYESTAIKSIACNIPQSPEEEKCVTVVCNSEKIASKLKSKLYGDYFRSVDCDGVDISLEHVNDNFEAAKIILQKLAELEHISRDQHGKASNLFKDLSALINQPA